MDKVKTIQDFENYMKDYRDSLYSKAIKASEILLDDEWMQENEWDILYLKEGEKLC